MGYSLSNAEPRGDADLGSGFEIVRGDESGFVFRRKRQKVQSIRKGAVSLPPKNQSHEHSALVKSLTDAISAALQRCVNETPLEMTDSSREAVIRKLLDRFASKIRTLDVVLCLARIADTDIPGMKGKPVYIAPLYR